MNSWRDKILKEFTPQVARLTLVADPDGLLLEERVLQEIIERGFELIPFDDHVAFRYAYESKFRSQWDLGEHTDLVVVLRSASNILDTLPYDLLQAGRKLSFNIGDFFPKLSYPVVSTLDKGDLDSLYRAQIQHKPDKLGDNGTKDFMLRHVFEIAPELIKQTSDLLRVLLRRHYRGQNIPAILDERFVQTIQHNGLFKDWPLEIIIPDREAFFVFLQERWPAFIDHLATKNSKAVVREKGPSYDLEYSGPLDLPFEHDDIRVYIDNLFIDGLLQTVAHENAINLGETWVSIGIRTNTGADRLRRLEALIDSINDNIPTEEARHSDWLQFSYRWAELSVLISKAETSLSTDINQRVETLRKQIDQVFMEWVQTRYAGLHNQPPMPPVMLHHIPRVLAHHISKSRQEKVAFLLVDGLALDQWIIMRDVITAQNPQLRLRESAVFAWIPTITSVSRQAAFAGKPPIYFPSSINTTNREASLWKQFWVDQGLSQHEVGYAKGLGDGDLDPVKEMISHPKVRVAGLVVDKVDKIMHGMELGAAGMFNQVQQWVSQGFMLKLFDLLLENNFLVYLSSDHGNVEAKGCGRPAEGAVADLRGERVRVYPDSLLRAGVKERFPKAIEWPSYGLPDDYLPLLAPNRFAFVPEGKTIVGHGGISIEELIVPLVQIERKET